MRVPSAAGITMNVQFKEPVTHRNRGRSTSGGSVFHNLVPVSFVVLANVCLYSTPCSCSLIDSSVV